MQLEQQLLCPLLEIKNRIIENIVADNFSPEILSGSRE